MQEKFPISVFASWIFYTLIILIAVFSWLERSKVSNVPFTHFVIEDTKVTLAIEEPVNRLDFALAGAVREDYIGIIAALEGTSIDLQNEWVVLKNSKGISGPITVSLSDPKNAFAKNRIKKVKVNGRTVNLAYFFHNSVKFNEEKASVRYLLSSKNMGYLFSSYIGIWLPSAIVFLLVPLAIVQGILALGINNELNNFIDQDKTEMFDGLTANFAVPLGLLGTIASIWTSFEMVSHDISDVSSVVELISTGMFTTFLSMLAFTAMSMRSQREKLVGDSDDSVKTEMPAVEIEPKDQDEIKK